MIQRSLEIPGRNVFFTVSGKVKFNSSSKIFPVYFQVLSKRNFNCWREENAFFRTIILLLLNSWNTYDWKTILRSYKRPLKEGLIAIEAICSRYRLCHYADRKNVRNMPNPKSGITFSEDCVKIYYSQKLGINFQHKYPAHTKIGAQS